MQFEIKALVACSILKDGWTGNREITCVAQHNVSVTYVRSYII